MSSSTDNNSINLNDPRDMELAQQIMFTTAVPGSYRLIAVNTAQHVKKNHVPQIVFNDINATILENMKRCVLQTISFAANVEEKMEKDGALRREVYANINSQTILSLKRE